ncbi:MAG TPA: hypothetical protein VEY09_00410 [Pyrinomonadaceae bacterium]|nr:hypothetical protein [Pyrinomonadaceae bacterium]
MKRQTSRRDPRPAPAREARRADGREPEVAAREPEEAARELSRLLEARGEWLVREGANARAVALRRGEWEVGVAAGALALSYWGEDGPRLWRVENWETRGDGLRLAASRRTGAVRATLELVPRAAAAETSAVVRAARLSVCERLAQLVAGHAGLRVESARLSAGARRGEPGRYARVCLRCGDETGGAGGGARRRGRRGGRARGRASAREVLATGPVVPPGTVEPESFLASALLWLARYDERPPGRAGVAAPRRELWLASDAKLAAAVGERLALLCPSLAGRVVLLEHDEELREMMPAPRPTLPELLARPAPRLFRPKPPEPGTLFESLTSLAPEAIDVVRSRHGETLRFRGLPFARARRVAGRESVWFGAGAGPRRRLLGEGNKEELLKLVADLSEHRRADAPERRHHFYRAAPEAWLESLLRRDITRLDPGLRLAPLHAQFRASPADASRAARPVDLLALRRDGRLVVIELKVSEDAAFALQAADYWRRIYTHHRAGHIRRAGLFDDADISDEPPLVYLVSPMLRFHRQFETLARSITPEVEMYRFDLNEDWRAGVRVARRARVV